MADSNSPAFNPPINKLPPDNDPQIIKVDLTEVDWGFRKSAQTGVMPSNSMTIKHVESGR